MSTEREQQPADPKRELSGESARILEAIDELHDMEVEKRQRPISTPEFHRLAEAITDKSRDVFRIAIDQEEAGNESPRGEETIEDVDRRERAEEPHDRA